jgi:transcriptional regulator with XRE-family HTH domain
MIIEEDNTMTLPKKEFVKARVHQAVTPGKALKMLRELQGLSQNDLARMTGISQSNISALEGDARQLGRDRALVLAKVLHVHPAVLLFPDFDMADVA